MSVAFQTALNAEGLLRLEGQWCDRELAVTARKRTDSIEASGLWANLLFVGDPLHSVGDEPILTKEADWK